MIRIITIICVISMMLCGCGYPELSQSAYKHATALYSICNQKDEARLEKYASILDDAKAKGEISEKEAEWLEDIVKQGRSKEWVDAASEARKMMADQVND